MASNCADGDSSSSSSGEEFASSLPNRTVKKVYFITYSRADLFKCPDKETFGEYVEEAFTFSSASKKQGSDSSSSSKLVERWAACQEPHKDGRIHFHACVLLGKNTRWLGARKYLKNHYGIDVNFADRKDPNYTAAFRYLCKFSRHVAMSPNHPAPETLLNGRSPRTSKASRTNIAKRRSVPDSSGATCSRSADPTPAKQRRLSKVDVMKIIQDENIRNETEFLALAKTQSSEGKPDLEEFVARTPEKSYRELISKTWKLAAAPGLVKRKNQSRMERVRELLEGECSPQCENKQWLKLACDLLDKNRIYKSVFAEAIRTLLEKGRGKRRNIILVGYKDCGKTFILDPLKIIFKCFANPSSGKYAFVGSQDCEVMFLNDLRWNPDMIPWMEFLNMLEGQTVRISTPKSHFAEDVVFDRDTPIFATGIEPIKFVGRSRNIEAENDMMDARWRRFDFKYEVPRDEQVEIGPCARCFAELVTSDDA